MIFARAAIAGSVLYQTEATLVGNESRSHHFRTHAIACISRRRDIYINYSKSIHSSMTWCEGWAYAIPLFTLFVLYTSASYLTTPRYNGRIFKHAWQVETLWLDTN